MSAVIKTSTPFTIELVLINALEVIGAEPVRINIINIKNYNQYGGLLEGDIVTNRRDYNGQQLFRFNGDIWQLQHDQDEYSAKVLSSKVTKQYQPVNRFLSTLNGAYQDAYLVHLEHVAEQERQRIEQDRIERVEMTRKQAIAKAKSQGYSVKEKHIKGKIQLVLTRSV